VAPWDAKGFVRYSGVFRERPCAVKGIEFGDWSQLTIFSGLGDAVSVHESQPETSAIGSLPNVRGSAGREM